MYTYKMVRKPKPKITVENVSTSYSQKIEAGDFYFENNNWFSNTWICIYVENTEKCNKI